MSQGLIMFSQTMDGYFADHCPHSRCRFAPAQLLSAKHLHNAWGPAVYLIKVPQSSLFVIILAKTTHKRNWREMNFCKWGENERHFSVGEGKKSLTVLDNFSANWTIMKYIVSPVFENEIGGDVPEDATDSRVNTGKKMLLVETCDLQGRVIHL